eukprot:gene10203-15690_t
MDAVQNEGRAAGAVSDWMFGASEGGKSALTSAVNPLLEYMESMESESLKHTNDERFLNKKMKDQVDALVSWYEEQDYERFLHYLAVFSKDRGSPLTDWPENEGIVRKDLIESIVAAREKRVMGPGLFNASLAALVQAKENADSVRGQKSVDMLVDAMLERAESEVDTIMGLKCLVLLCSTQDRTGETEALMVKNPRLVPHLLTLLQNDSKNVFEARYPSQLLSCILRTNPSVLQDSLSGKYKDANGNPLTVYRALREGIRFKDSWSIQYYIRLLRDLVTVDEKQALRGFHEAELLPVLVGLLQNNWGYVEVMPPVVRLMRMLLESSPEPGFLLAYKDFLLIASTVVEKAGPFHHEMVRDLYECVDVALHDVTLPASFLHTKRTVLERFRLSVLSILAKPELDHISRKWIEADLKAMQNASVTNA